MAMILSGKENAGEVNASGELVIKCEGGVEVYGMTTIPSATMSLVEDAKGKILGDLGLERVLTDLNRASDLLFLAYLGVVGTGELHARISNRQKELAVLCGDCVVTMTALVDCSLDVLDRVTEAYEYLLNAREDRALRILSRCAKSAKTMASKCETLAHGFKKLADDTKEDAATATRAWGAQGEKMKVLEKLRNDMEATKITQQTLTEGYNKMIEDMKVDIVTLEAKEDLADQRAFIAEIMGVLAKTVGAGINAYVSTTQPFPVPTRGSEEASEDGKPSAEQQRKLKGEKATAKKSLRDAETAEEEADSNEQKLQRKVFAAGADKRSKEKLFNSAEAADQTEAGYKDKLKEAKAELDASVAALSKVEEEHELAQTAAEKAKKSVKDATAALAALSQAGESARQAAQQQANRAAALNECRMKMLKEKLKMEKNRLDSVAQVAALTARLGSTAHEMQVEESARTALEIATWALDNIYTSLLDAKFFWEKMTSFCQKLTDPEVLEKIKDEMNDGSNDPEARKTVYKSKRFVKEAVGYLARWAALASVCQDYVTASTKARKSVLGHIRASPNEEEARKLLAPIKAQLKDELQEYAAELNTTIRGLQNESKEITQ